MPFFSSSSKFFPFIVGAAVIAMAVSAGSAARVDVNAEPVVPTGIGLADLGDGELLASKTFDLNVADFVTGQELFSAELEHWVTKAEDSGRLDFHYRVTNVPQPLGMEILRRFTAFGFGPGFELDADFVSDTAGHPSLASRTDNVVDFAFDDANGELGSDESAWFFIRSNARQFEADGFAIADVPTEAGELRSTLVNGTFRPTAVPLPAAIYTGLACLACAAAVRRRCVLR